MPNPIYFVSGLAGHRFKKRTILNIPTPTPTNDNVTLQPDTKIIFVQVYGAGGSGGGANVDPAEEPLLSDATPTGFSIGSGGGAGGYVELWLNVNGGDVIDYRVGAGGIGTSSVGSTGGDSTFGTYIIAEGGVGGSSFTGSIKSNGSNNLPITLTDPNQITGYVTRGVGGNGTITGANPSLDTGIIIEGGDGVEGTYAYSDAFKILSLLSGTGGISSRSSLKNIRLNGKFNISSTITAETSAIINLDGTGFGNGGAGAYAICNASAESDNGGNGANGVIIITEYSA